MPDAECRLSYMTHRRRGEDPCIECRRKWRDRQRAYRARKEIT